MQQLNSHHLKILRLVNGWLFAIYGTFLFPAIIYGADFAFEITSATFVGTFLFNTLMHFCAPMRSVTANVLGNLMSGAIGIAAYDPVVTGSYSADQIPKVAFVMLFVGWFIYLPGTVLFVTLDWLILRTCRNA